ncbi:hypothetical protein [Phyllobacterium brassicacearum]|uniref:hypothetical protein n=1 Tax=Phyllobacterium brassicacearum TaxID=314235 RepID=UPI00105E7B02|nr:hypothetical protein [Phyllobacterium brassicacearum]
MISANDFQSVFSGHARIAQQMIAGFVQECQQELLLVSGGTPGLHELRQEIWGGKHVSGSKLDAT